MPKFVVPAGGDDGEERLGVVVLEDRRAGWAPVSRQRSSTGTADQLGVHDVAGGLRSTSARRRSRRPARAARPAGLRRVRRAVCRAATSADRLPIVPPGTNDAAGSGRQPGEVGDPAQGLVLGVDGARALEPRAAVDRRRADDEVEHRRGLASGRTG